MKALAYQNREEDIHPFTLLWDFLYYQLIPLLIILFFLGIYRVETKILKYISGTLAYHSLSEKLKEHSLLSSHTVEPHLANQRSLDLKKSLNLDIV